MALPIRSMFGVAYRLRKKRLPCFLRNSIHMNGHADTSILGNAYRNLLTGDRAHNLQQAIACYKAALRVFTEDNFIQEYAMTQNNLGNAYSELPVGDPDTNLQYAIDCYEATLRVFTEAEFPQDWPKTLHNLGAAYDNILSLATEMPICNTPLTAIKPLCASAPKQAIRMSGQGRNTTWAMRTEAFSPATGHTTCNRQSPAIRPLCACLQKPPFLTSGPVRKITWALHTVTFPLATETPICNTPLTVTRQH